MSEQDVETLRGAYESFNAGKVEEVLAIMDEDVQWTEPGGGNAPKGTFSGPQAVAQEVFAPVPENFDEFTVEPQDFDDRGDTVVVTGRYKGKNKSGAELDSAFEHTFEMKDGKMTRSESKFDEGWAAGWS